LNISKPNIMSPTTVPLDEPSIPRPPFDPAFNGAYGTPGAPLDIDLDLMRPFVNGTAAPILATYPNITHRDLTISSVSDLDSNTITLATFETKTSTNKNRATLLMVHGGGQVLGNRFFGVEQILSILPITDDLLVASVEYRLAPEHRAPAGAYDCYAAVVYLAEHAAELGIDADRILVYGISGGAPLVAATGFLARKRGGPNIRALMLSIPMLDDRDDDYVSSKQYESGTTWSTRKNRQAWSMVLGPEPDFSAESDVELRVPARAKDLTNLPPIFVDVGECEVFRDSALAFANEVQKQGGSCELHVWPGMYHAGFAFEPEPLVSQAAAFVQRSFAERLLGLKGNKSEAMPDIAKASL
jgi:acetyl esterase/lipase